MPEEIKLNLNENISFHEQNCNCANCKKERAVKEENNVQKNQITKTDKSE